MANDNIKRTVYVDKTVWEELSAHYRVHGISISEVIRTTLTSLHRGLREEGKMTTAKPIDLAEQIQLGTNPKGTEEND